MVLDAAKTFTFVKPLFVCIDEKRIMMYQSEFCDVTYLENLNVVFVKWKKFCRQDDYRKPLLYALDIMKSRPDCNYVADTRDGFENEAADTQWLFDIFFPQTAQTTCKAFFFIIDSDNNLKQELERQSAQLKKKFDIHYCFGLDEVTFLLKQYCPE